MKLIHCNQSVIEGFDAKFVDGKAESRVGADQHLVVALQERSKW